MKKVVRFGKKKEKRKKVMNKFRNKKRSERRRLQMGMVATKLVGMPPLPLISPPMISFPYEHFFS